MQPSTMYESSPLWHAIAAYMATYVLVKQQLHHQPIVQTNSPQTTDIPWAQVIAIPVGIIIYKAYSRMLR